jgi:uncharacterized protein (TIGR01777 family)
VKVTIIGSSGFIGRRLSVALRSRGDTVVGVSFREPTTAWRECDGADAVVNLAGENIAQRWTQASKEQIRSSRVDAPRQLIDMFGALKAPPRAYISASAVGYYGTSETQTFTEASPPGNDFLAEVCRAWEEQAQKAASHGCRVAIVRCGLVLATDGGVLARVLPIFRLGAGGIVGSGNQWYSWIHIDDVIGIYTMAIDGAAGVFNATAPNPVRNRDFTRALAGALHRPAFVRVPDAALEKVLGEGALLATQGQCVIPEHTLAQGYGFAYTQVERACSALVQKKPKEQPAKR